jgi:hypothetical protein
MVGGALCYATFHATFLYLREWLLYTSSVLLGFGAARRSQNTLSCPNSSCSVIWTAQGNYFTLNSDEHTIARNTGVLWIIYQTGCGEKINNSTKLHSLIVGGMFLYLLFANETKTDLDVGTSRLCYTVFLVVVVLGGCVLGLLRAPQLPPAAAREFGSGIGLFLSKASLPNSYRRRRERYHECNCRHRWQRRNQCIVSWWFSTASRSY